MIGAPGRLVAGSLNDERGGRRAPSPLRLNDGASRCECLPGSESSQEIVPPPGESDSAIAHIGHARDSGVQRAAREETVFQQ